MTELRKRFMQDLTLAGYSEKTVALYMHTVRRLAEYYECSPEKLLPQDIKDYLIHLIKKKNFQLRISSRRRARRNSSGH